MAAAKTPLKGTGEQGTPLKCTGEQGTPLKGTEGMRGTPLKGAGEMRAARERVRAAPRAFCPHLCGQG